MLDCDGALLISLEYGGTFDEGRGDEDEGRWDVLDGVKGLTELPLDISDEDIVDVAELDGNTDWPSCCEAETDADDSERDDTVDDTKLDCDGDFADVRF